MTLRAVGGSNSKLDAADMYDMVPCLCLFQFSNLESYGQLGNG